MSTYLDNKELDHLLSKAAFTQPTVWLRLSTTDPGADGSTETEPVGGSYDQLQTSASDWNSAAAGASTNAVAFLWTEATGSWGTITHVSAWDSDIGGNFLGAGALTVSKAISSGQVFRIPIGNFTWTKA